MNELAGAQDLNERLEAVDAQVHAANLRRLVDAEREQGHATALEAAARAVTSERWYQALALMVMGAMVATVIVVMVIAA